jgi:membrane protease YdiL (CAAX protease family)
MINRRYEVGEGGNRNARTGLPYVGQLVLGVSIWMMFRRTNFPAEAVGLKWDGWQTATAAGVVAGLAWSGFYEWLLRIGRPSKQQLARHLLAQRSRAFWIPLSLSASVLEELWRAFCLVALGGNVAAIGVTAIACGLAHPQSLGRVASATLFAIYAACLFLWTRSLWATVPAHALVNLGAIVLIHSRSSRV